MLTTVDSSCGYDVTKVFQIGFSKCGTSSIHERLELLGLRSIHNDGGMIAKNIVNSNGNLVEALAEYSIYDALTDMHHFDESCRYEGYKRYRELDQAFPGSKFILNTRDKLDWLNSSSNHPKFLQTMTQLYSCSRIELEERLLSDWDLHHKDVVEYFPRDQLLIFNIDTDDASEIDRFLGISSSLPDGLPHINATPGSTYDLLLRIVPRSALNWLPAKFRWKLTHLLRRLP